MLAPGGGVPALPDRRLPGDLCLILHAHLPYVRHRDPGSLEELWLFEALTESYLPLVEKLRSLAERAYPVRIALSVTPPLVEMLRDPLLQYRYRLFLETRLELAEREVWRTRGQPELAGLARMYRDRFVGAWNLFVNRYRSDMLRALGELADSGVIELVASAATHGYLPLMEVAPEAARAQVRLGVLAHRRRFGRAPGGFWLPECGYHPRFDSALVQAGVRWVVLESHGLLHAHPRPRYAVYAPIYTPVGLACFGRDWESSRQVWSADEGYPGDPEYRDFYRDIGFDLDEAYLAPYLGAGVRGFTGLKYYRVTGRTGDKELYRPEAARRRVEVHAGNFVFNRARQVDYLSGVMDRPPVVIAPYDAELFGHWWFEGPEWLEAVCCQAAHEQHVFRLRSPGQVLEDGRSLQLVLPSTSSWGYGGYHEVWLEASNDWIYPHLHQAAWRMAELARRFATAGDLQARACAQAARELLLAQSSDWAFIMKTGTMVPYAVRRTREHLAAFTRLYEGLTRGHVDPGYLAALEEEHPFLADFSWSDFCSAYQGS